MEKITIGDYDYAISNIADHKAPGPSSIAPLHVKYISDLSPAFKELFVKICNEVLEDPEKMVERLEPLYEFRSIFIPKDENSWRPIAIGE